MVPRLSLDGAFAGIQFWLPEEGMDQSTQQYIFNALKLFPWTSASQPSNVAFQLDAHCRCTVIFPCSSVPVAKSDWIPFF